jgi:23S rRNA (cytosine1962-C5)-methyltransferase
VTYPVIRLQPNRHKRVAAGHPWVYSNEIVMDAAAKALPPGTLVRFVAAEPTLLGIGSFHPHNLICGRIFARHEGLIDAAWFVAQFTHALALRERLFTAPYYRLVHAEADGLPGLIIDRYGAHCIVQMNSAGMEQQSAAIVAALTTLLQPASILLRNDGGARLQEGLPQNVTLAAGTLPERLELIENGLRFVTDPTSGQKTGWFYDQRYNRALVAGFCHDARVLDVYCHTGGFALNAAAAGARAVLGIDASELALQCAAQAAAHNQLADRTSWQRGEAFALLADHAARGEQFDVVVADPPAFIKSRKDIATGTRGYRKLVRLAATLVKPGGLLFIASCSHHLTLAALTEQLAAGLQDAGRTGQILHTVFAAPDHPVHPHLPESAYLKGLLVRV